MKKLKILFTLGSRPYFNLEENRFIEEKKQELINVNIDCQMTNGFYSSFYSSRGNQICYPGGYNFTDNKVITDKFFSIFKENNCVPNKQPQGLNFYEEEFSQAGSAIFYGGRKEADLYLLIAVEKFIHQNSDNIAIDTNIFSQSEIDRNGLNEEIREQFSCLSSPLSITTPSEELIKAYTEQQDIAQKEKIKVIEFENNLKSIFNNSNVNHNANLNQLINDLNQEITNTLIKYSYLTDLVKFEVIKILAKFYRECIAIQSIDFAQSILEQFKKILTDFFQDPIVLQQIESSNPVDICYDIALHYLTLTKSYLTNPQTGLNEFNCEKSHENSLFWMRFASSLGQSDKKMEVAKNISPAIFNFYGVDLEFPEEITIYLVRNVHEIDLCHIKKFIQRCDWSENNALEVIEIIASTPALAAVICEFQSLMKSPRACLAILTHPALVKSIKQTSEFNDILYKASEIILQDIKLSRSNISQQTKMYIQFILENADQIKKNSSWKFDQSINKIFSALKDKAKNNISFQLLVGYIYGKSSSFTEINTIKSCKYLFQPALAGNREALQMLLSLEQDDDISYALGQIYLERKDMHNALRHFSKVSPSHSNYSEAMFECGNIEYCFNRNKSKGHHYFSQPDTKIPAVLVESCRPRTAPHAALTDLYVYQANGSGPLQVSGITFPRDLRTLFQLFGNTRDKKIGLKKLHFIWEKYKNNISNNNDDIYTNEAAFIYEKACSPIYNDVGRYLILREYFLNKNNEQDEFHHLLKQEFGEDFFADKKEKKDVCNNNYHTDLRV